jgi:hypothetical protein
MIEKPRAGAAPAGRKPENPPRNWDFREKRSAEK